MYYAHLNTTTHYTFLTGASSPEELVWRAHALGYRALAITDECSLAGVVKAHNAAKTCGLKLLIGSRFVLQNGLTLIAIAPDRAAYAELSGMITLARRRAKKGTYEARMTDLRFRLQRCWVLWLAESTRHCTEELAVVLKQAFKQRLWLGVDNSQSRGGDAERLQAWVRLAEVHAIPLVACGHVLMHERQRKPLQDVLTAIKTRVPVAECGSQLHSNAEAYLKPLAELCQRYPKALLQATITLAETCTFSLEELRYQYPEEVVPAHLTPDVYLHQLVHAGKQQRYPEGAPVEVEQLLQKELALIHDLQYEYYFLTVYDIVRFARSRSILCQGRGSAANSVVCYCLHITEIAPGQINVLFERFISKERDEPPDIDVDFEHERREEVIQYIYQKYGRERAALAATVITYRARSAIRDVGKALGLAPTLIEHLAKDLSWWDRNRELQKRISDTHNDQPLWRLFHLVQQLLGFPRHLSQHVGGFVITQSKISDLVPLENASMPERTVIQWDKEDIESLSLLKVDVLALGMLTALRKALQMVSTYEPGVARLQDIPREDAATYRMLSAGDSVGVFQVESRAQMSMLPRLRPRCFYDLVIEIAIVRPGPIQGDMVHPYLRRRNGEEPVQYESEALEAVLSPTLGVPIFQEQAIRLAMVAAGFSGGEADRLRRAMASWGKNGNLLQFEQKFKQGMLDNGYSVDYATRLFEQIKGFGGYGFPESHSASFALLCYASSWLKCHHPAAFYCALLNSQPMGFYSPSQLVQDACRHQVTVLPVDINASDYDNQLEALADNTLAIRLGFCRVKSLNTQKAQAIAARRGPKPFTSLEDLAKRAGLDSVAVKHLAAADALRSLSGDRHQAHWQASALQTQTPLLQGSETHDEPLRMAAPKVQKDVVDDYNALGLTLRAHPLSLLRAAAPFNRCKRQVELAGLRHGQFVRVAGLVTGRQRPGTAKGTVFLTLEDETGNINVVVWKSTQENFRQALLSARLLLVKGVVEISEQVEGSVPVVHVVAGQLIDLSEQLDEAMALRSRDFH